MLPRTAREVFEYIRRQPGIGPESLPWRWSTFALGKTLFLIAENEKKKNAIPSQNNSISESMTTVKKTTDDIRGFYQAAMDVLIEGLNRYVLYPQHPSGIREDQDPKNYQTIKKNRFRSLYYLGLCYKEVGNASAMQRTLSTMLDGDIYPMDKWKKDNSVYAIYKNSFFYLAQSFYKNGKYQEAYDIYESANDKLKSNNSPYFVYMMGECLLAMGKKRLAKSKYIQARHAISVSDKKRKKMASKDLLLNFGKS